MDAPRYSRHHPRRTNALSAAAGRMCARSAIMLCSYHEGWDTHQRARTTTSCGDHSVDDPRRGGNGRDRSTTRRGIARLMIHDAPGGPRLTPVFPRHEPLMGSCHLGGIIGVMTRTSRHHAPIRHHHPPQPFKNPQVHQTVGRLFRGGASAHPRRAGPRPHDPRRVVDHRRLTRAPARRLTARGEQRADLGAQRGDVLHVLWAALR
jgi:hypothetical protein